MKAFHILLTNELKKALLDIYHFSIEKLDFQETKKEFEGDITVVLFSLLKPLQENPARLGEAIGNYLIEKTNLVEKFNVVAGFLNLTLRDSVLLNYFNNIKNDTQYGLSKPSITSPTIMVEFASPNTNKPLHLGHIRNILLGDSVARLLYAAGYNVHKTQIINDRGIHICKSMVAWQMSEKNETPITTGLKGDKLVGNYYVAFDKKFKEEVTNLKNVKGITEEEAKKHAPILLEAQKMLQQWESGDANVISLWKTMNQWVYDGFEVTYKNLDVSFDSYYYESNTYLLGKEVVQLGLDRGIFEKDPDGSVWIDLTTDGLDRKIVLRADGTSVYMTQDIGTAIQRVKDYPQTSGMVYTVGNEQDYHFKVLFLILKKLGFEWAKNLYHLSYGMVELPSGKMKSREGTVVDADDLIEEMISTAKEISTELGKLDGYDKNEKEALFKIIGLGALKYYILKVDPKKQILFNPKESVDFNGNTGPFIQYTYARIQSILRKANFNYQFEITETTFEPKEKNVLKQLCHFPDIIKEAAEKYSPALVANYVYDLVKEFNSFYQTIPILGEENEEKKIFRVQLCALVGNTIKNALNILGINAPERM